MSDIQGANRMKKRKFLLIILITVVSIFSTVPALAGGWATISVDDLPGRISAGEEVKIGFMVRQHGITPMSDLKPILSFSRLDAKDRFVVNAFPQGKVGHYVASVTIPAAGLWSWSIQAFTMDQPMPALTVTEASAAQPAASEPLPAVWTLAGLSGLVCLAGSGWAFLRKRPRLSVALAVIGLAIAGAGLVFGTGQAAQPPSTSSAEESNSYVLAETGQRLFVSKGCVSCHVNGRIEQVYSPFTTAIGPDLTNFSAASEYLQMWLADPVAVKPATKMPDLDLNPAEIEALIAFINSDTEK
jgi:cytochrome c2